MVNLGPWSVTDEDTLLACFVESVAPVYRNASRLTGSDRISTDSVVQDVYCGLARSARAGDVAEVDVGWLLDRVRHAFIDGTGVEPPRPVGVGSTSATEVYEIRVDEPELALLPSRDRAALVFHYLDELPVVEVAGLLGLSVHATESALARARRRAGVHESPDTRARLEQMSGDGLEPTTQFVTTVRRRLTGEWRGDPVEVPVVAPTGPSGAGRWWRPAIAVVAVVAVLGVVGWIGGQDNRDPRNIASSPSSVPVVGSTLPGVALGHVWVVTAVGDVSWANPVMASFTLESAGLLSGPGFGGLSVAGPYTFPSAYVLRTDHIVAERFDRPEVVPGPQLDRAYWFGTAGSVTLRGNGTAVVAVDGCDVAGTGVWQLTEHHLQLSVAVPGCTVQDPDFRSWLEGMNSTGGEISFHIGGSGGMWTMIEGQVARLVPAAPSLRHTLGTDATPDAGGLRVAQWTGAALESQGIILDGAHLGVRVDGALASLSGDGSVVMVVDDHGTLREGAVVDPDGPGFSRMSIQPGDVASLVGVGGASRVSVRSATMGEPAAPLAAVDVRGPEPECTYDVEFGTQSWIVPLRECASALVDPVPLDNGSVIALTRDVIPNDAATGLDAVIELAAIRLNLDGTRQRVVLGRHAVDGSEGWVTVQPTETGAFVVYRYPDDSVVLYRYLFE